MTPRILDGLGFAKWPSIALVTLVPAWFYLNGWDGGFGAPRVPVATVALDGRSYALWWSGTPVGGNIWCAQPLGPGKASKELMLVSGNVEVPARFEAGLFCAELPEAPGMPRLRSR